MTRLNIVFVASEATPLAKTGGLADVVGSLPLALKKLKHQVSVILPFYRKQLASAGIKTRPMKVEIEMWADGIQYLCPLHSARVGGLDFVLVEQDDLYGRDELYGPPGGAYKDNLLRYLLFGRVALESAARLGKKVDIIHCHDWQTGMIPLLFKTQYQHHAKIAHAKTVYTIHNLAYQGIFVADWIHRLGIPSHHFHPEGFEFHGQINCMKAAIESSDAITTVSPSYAEEILTVEYGCELEGFLQEHISKLSGIVNGLNINEWNPVTDSVIEVNYGPGNIAGKKKCKQALQKHCSFKVSAETPLLTLISRLAEQKGIDFIIANIEAWMKRGYQLVILGSGQPEIEQLLQNLARKYSQQFYFCRGFNETLGRQIYAGGDLFLMPSRFEPCGLGQMIAMRYGTVPVVRATGGLRDTVTDYNASRSKATGFHFSEATTRAFDIAVKQGVSLLNTPRIWSRIRSNALKRDSSWDISAQAYVKLYKSLINIQTVK